MTPRSILPVTLTDDERTTLRRLARTKTNPTIAWRARALLLLDQGLTLRQAADQVGVTYQCLSMVVPYFLGSVGRPMVERLQSGPDTRYAAHRFKLQAVPAEIRKLLEESPTAYGFDSPHWTVALMMVQVSRNLDMPVSYDTVRSALNRLGYSLRNLRKGNGEPALV